MSGIIGVSPDMRSGVLGKYPDGQVIQVSSQVRNTSNQTIGSTTYTDLTNLTLSITPSSTSSKILLKCFKYF